MEDDVPGRKPKFAGVCKNVDLCYAWQRSEEFIGKTVGFLIEKLSKSKEEFSGRNSQSITVVFPKEDYKLVIL
jgi:tRNA-2-methylthio-N6-dimethylallyladenosine synthase